MINISEKLKGQVRWQVWGPVRWQVREQVWDNFQREVKRDD